MEIGEVLKNLRNSKRMTQKDFAQDICSTSFLSKVENNEHRISAEDLFLLLKQNDIEIHDFYLTVFGEGTLNQSNDISKAYYTGDLDYLKDFVSATSKSNDSNRKYYQLVANIMIFILKKDIASLPKEIVMEAKSQFFDNQNWNELTLTLLVNIVLLYEIETVELFLEDILKKYPLDKSSIKIVKLIYALILNLIYMLILDKKMEKAVFYVGILDEIRVVPELMFSSSILNYYKCLTKYVIQPDNFHFLQVEKAIEVFKILRMDEIYKQLHEYKDKILLTYHLKQLSCEHVE